MSTQQEEPKQKQRQNKQYVHHVQSRYLVKHIKSEHPVTFYLNSGKRISGVITAFDRFTLTVNATTKKGEVKECLLFKQHIEAIMPSDVSE